MFWLPTVGKGGLFLAMGATLLPLFWEHISVFAKMSWIAMLFLLLGVEYRAIDKEHRENALAQQEALKTIGDGFTKVLTDQKNSFSTLVTQSNEAFKQTTEQASDQFDATMKRAQDNLNHMTGGDTYPLVVPILVPLGNAPNTFRLVIQAVGDSPLFDVDASLMKLPFPATRSYTDYLSGKDSDDTHLFSGASLSPNRVEMLGPTVTISDTGQTDYSIATLARNGTFNERLHIKKTGNDLKREGTALVLPYSFSCEVTRERIGKDKKAHQTQVTAIPWQIFSVANGQATPQK